MTDTYVDVVSGESILVQIGDGADPEVFAHDCLINGTRGVSLTANVIEQSIPNCTDPSKPDKIVRRVDSNDSTITGEGKLNSASSLVWLARRGTIVNVKVRQAGVWKIEGAYILSEFSISGEARGYATASVTLVQADEPTITADVP